MDNVRRKHLSFRKARIKMLVSDQVAETCDACDRKEDLRAFLFFYKNTWRKICQRSQLNPLLHTLIR